jgi:DNA-binding MarR family transcriptional regulator
MNTSLPFTSQQIISYLALCAEPKGLIDITANTGVSYSAVSIQTRLLIARGLLERVKAGKVVTFRLAAVPPEVAV